MVSAEGFEPSYLVTPQIRTAVIGTYEQQVVIRVVGYPWCLCPVCAAARAHETGVSFSLCFLGCCKIA